jgi:hypothetical protein
MGRGKILNYIGDHAPREGGYTLVELTVTLCLLMAISIFGLKTMVAGSTMQNWAIAQSMTDAYAGIETSIAEREVFANISTDPYRALYPAFFSSTVLIGQTPVGSVTATVVRTTVVNPPDPVTGALSYLLESYVTYTNGPRNYCKVSKVYRSQ